MILEPMVCCVNIVILVAGDCIYHPGVAGIRSLLGEDIYL